MFKRKKYIKKEGGNKHVKKTKVRSNKSSVLRSIRSDCEIDIVTTYRELSALLGYSLIELRMMTQAMNIAPDRDSLLYTEVRDLVKRFNCPTKINLSTRATGIESILNNQSQRIKIKPLIGFVGHVNHGKTTIVSLLAEKSITEFNDITQNIALYNLKNYSIIDTPGHGFFTYIRSQALDVMDAIFLVIDSTDRINFETESIINYIEEHQYNDRVIILITKSDISTVEQQKNIEKELRYMMPGNLIFTVNKNIDMNAVILQGLSTLSTMRKLRPSIQIISIHHNKLICKINRGSINRSGMIVIDDKKYDIRSIEDFEGNNVESIESEDICIIRTKESIHRVRRTQEIYFFEDRTMMTNWLSYIHYKNNIFSNKIESDTRERTEIIKDLVLVSNSYDMIENIATHIDDRYIRISGRFTTISKDTIVGIDKKTEMLIYQYTMTDEIRKILREKGIEFREYLSIYDLLDYFKEIKETYLFPDSAKNIAEIVKQFKLKNLKVIGCIVKMGRFAVSDWVYSTRTEGEPIRTQIISMKKKDKFVKQVNKGDEIGIVVKDPELFNDKSTIIYS